MREMESSPMNKNLIRKGALLFAAFAAAVFMPLATKAAETGPSSAPNSAVVMTVTATAKHDAQPPALAKSDVELYQGKERVQVADFKRGDALYLAILIDDSLRSDIANQWSDLRNFINSQPGTTYVAVAYARNGVAMIAQDF